MTSLGFTMPPTDPALHGDLEVDRLCREFERAWWRGESRPLLADWIAKGTAAHPAELRRELVAVEIELRLVAGEAATAVEYQQCYPDLGEWIADLFADKPAHPTEAATRTGLPFIPTRLGDYRIVREIGRGGMGVVYEAVQESLGRRVAIKCLSASPFLTERHLKRFRQEARAVAKLHHNHIVEVYGLAVQHGLHYFAMQYVDGCGLDAVIGGNRPRTSTESADEPKSSDDPVRRGSPDPAEALDRTVSTTSGRPAVEVCAGSGDPRTTPVESPESKAPPPDNVADFPRVALLRDFHEPERMDLISQIGRQIAGALHYAHTRGVLHRDAKPSNILLDREGNAWLSDFGLAKIVTDSNPLSDSEDVVGTLRYMAPEMLDHVSDARTDVYILGLTLYELLTFQPAFPETDRSRLMYQVLESSPVPPRELNPAIPADLETIVLKAVAREPDGRYQSAAELANDLRRFVERRPILARRVTWTRRFTRWCQREPVLSSLAVGFVFLLASGLFSVTWQWRNAVRMQGYLLRQRDLAIRSQMDLDKALRQAESSRREVESSRDDLAQSRIDAETARDEARHHEEAALSHLVQFHRVMGVDALEAGDVGRALLWTMQAAYQAEALEARRDTPLDAAKSNGRLPVADALRLRIRSLVDAMPRPLLMACAREILTDDMTAPDVVPDGDRSASGQTFFGADDDQVWVTNRRGTRVLRWNLSTSEPDPVAPVAGDKSVFVGNGLRAGVRHRKIQNRRGESGETSDSFVPPISNFAVPDPKAPDVGDVGLQMVPAGIRDGKISPDGRLVAFGDQSGTIRVWSVRGGQPVTPPLQLLDVVASLAWSADGSRIAVLSDKGLLTVWDLAGLTPDHLLARGDARPIRSVRYSPDGSRLVAATDHGPLRLWDVAAGQPVGEPFVVPTAPHQLTWSRDGSAFAAILGDATSPDVDQHHALRLQVWSADSRQLLGSLDLSFDRDDASPTLAAPFDSDSPRLDVSQLAAGLAAWQLGPGGLRLEVRHRDGNTLVAAMADGSRLAHVESPGQVALVTNSGRELRRCPMPDGRHITWLGFNRTGRVLAAASERRFRAWDADSGRVLTDGSPIAETRVMTGVFRDDGRALLLVTDDEECQVWDTATWQPISPSFRLRGPNVLTGFVAGGQLVVTVSELGLVRVWDWSRGEPIMMAKRSHAPLIAADLSPDGRQLVVAGNDGSLRLVDLTTEAGALASSLDLLVSLLSGSRIDHEHGLLFPLTPDDLCEAWSRLRASRSDLVTPHAAARRLWHLRQLAEAELEQDVAAQLFHREHISPRADE